MCTDETTTPTYESPDDTGQGTYEAPDDGTPGGRGVVGRRTFLKAAALGTAAAALKHTMPGDLLTITPDEVERYLAAGSAKVQR